MSMTLQALPSQYFRSAQCAVIYGDLSYGLLAEAYQAGCYGPNEPRVLRAHPTTLDMIRALSVYRLRQHEAPATVNHFETAEFYEDACLPIGVIWLTQSGKQFDDARRSADVWIVCAITKD